MDVGTSAWGSHIKGFLETSIFYPQTIWVIFLQKALGSQWGAKPRNPGSFVSL